MTKLFPDSDTFQKERPSRLTKAQENAFWIKMATEVQERHWCNDNISVIAEDLSERDLSDNGFEIAKDLDDWGNGSYDIDVNFCQWLDELHYEYNLEKAKNIEAWVKAHDIKPKFKLGDKLKSNGSVSFDHKNGSVFYINGIASNIARYVIDEDPDRKGGTIVNFETVEKYCELIVEDK